MFALRRGGEGHSLEARMRGRSLSSKSEMCVYVGEYVILYIQHVCYRRPLYARQAGTSSD